MPPTPFPRVRALRGATTLEVDERAHLFERTQELIATLFERNGLVEDDLVSILFTATDDLRCAFPAEAAREAGITHVPLMCARELDIDGAMARCVRVLVHAYTAATPTQLRHVYLHGARQLRTDLPE
ncbi:MAG: chorismate mutase [Nitriliruptoraceae bacterium]|nr:chorismate mutase [Nitriliruptoraceae bacterium]